MPAPFTVIAFTLSIVLYGCTSLIISPPFPPSFHSVTAACLPFCVGAGCQDLPAMGAVSIQSWLPMEEAPGCSGTQPPFSNKVVQWVMSICVMMIPDEPLFLPLQLREQRQHWHEITWALLVHRYYIKRESNK